MVGSEKKNLFKSLEKLKKLNLLKLSSDSNSNYSGSAPVSNSKKKNSNSYKYNVNKSVFVVTDSKDQDICVEKLKKYGARIKDIINSGTYGTISDICYSDVKCPYIIKAQSFDYDNRPYKNEVEIMKKLVGKNIMPRMVDFWECKYNVKLPGVKIDKPVTVGYIVQEKWDGNLRELIGKQNGLKRSQLKSIIKLLQKLHIENIIHGDPHPGNIVYKFKKKKENKKKTQSVKFGLIDFGLSFDLSKKSVGRYRPFFRSDAFTGKRYVDHDFIYLEDSLLFLLNIDASDILKKYYDRKKVYPYLPFHVNNNKLLEE